MQVRHFEALGPVCPRCREQRDEESPLRLGLVVRREGDSILEGALHCPSKECYAEYPIVDGIPILVTDVRSYVASNVFHLVARDDLSDEVEAIIGDCCGPGSAYDTLRFHLSTYAWDHYADLDPLEPASSPGSGSAVRILRRGLELARSLPAGPVLDAGCSVGRTSFELARETGELVLGIDTNLSMLRLAARARGDGRLSYPRRSLGLVYDRREVALPWEPPQNLDFWACDAASLPFGAESFGTAVSLNLLDCVPSPLDLLQSLERALRPGGLLLLTSPYDWSGAVSPPETWLGGHTKRAPDGGRSEAILRALLTPGAHAASLARLELAAEEERVPWHVRVHERSAMAYDVHLVVARRLAG